MEVDAHSVIRSFFRVSNTQNWLYDVENGVLECEDTPIKHKDEVRKFIISMFKGKKLDQIRALEKVRNNVLVDNEDNYKNTLLRLKTYKNVKIKGDVCECCGNVI